MAIHADLDPEETLSEEPSDIARQAEETREHRGCLWDTHFYKLVLGGNVSLVRQVVELMDEKKMRATRDWLFQRSEHDSQAAAATARRDRGDRIVRGKKLLLFLFLGLLNVVLSPVFYALHFLSVSWWSRKQKQISEENMRLPLAFAVFSQNPEMMRYFLTLDVDIDDTDHAGNNIFHYIGDMSSQSPDNGVEMLGSVVRLVHDTSLLRRLVMEQRNSSGLTPVEYTCMVGAPALVTEMLRCQRLISLSAGDDDSKSSSAKLELVDVSLYESGSIMEMSRLLNLLSDRDVSSMEKEQLEVFRNKELLGKWTWLKTKQMMGGVVILQIIEVIITVLMLVTLSNTNEGRLGMTYDQWYVRHRGEASLNEIIAWQSNRSVIFKDASFQRIVEELRTEQQLWLLYQFKEEDPVKFSMLMNATSASDKQPSLRRFYDREHHEWFLPQLYALSAEEPTYIPKDNLTRTELDALSDVAISMNDTFKEHETELYLWRYYFTFIQKLGHDIQHNRDDIFQNLVYLGSSGAKQFYDEFTFTVGDKVIRPSLVLTVEQLMGNLCVPNYLYDHTDLREVDHITLTGSLHQHSMDACQSIIIMKAASKKVGCQGTAHDVAETIKAAFERNWSTEHTWWAPRFVQMCTILYILMDILERLVFVSTCIRCHSSVSAMLHTFLSMKVPGSYARKQLNMLSYVAIIAGTLYDQNLSNVSMSESIVDHLELLGIGKIVFIVAIVIRFVMHIHSLRLLPGIGNFVITTFMMASNLLHFSTVFGCVLITFSALFYILVDNPDCPAEKRDGFTSFAKAMLSTFMLTFGHGDVEPFVTGAPAQLIYVLYVGIMVVLLLNLIIAIMSTTAMEIMVEPWKGTLWKMEWLDEATSVEYCFGVLSLPFKRITRCGFYFHTRAGYIVKKMSDNQYRIYIELFRLKKVHTFTGNNGGNADNVQV